VIRALSLVVAALAALAVIVVAVAVWDPLGERGTTLRSTPSVVVAVKDLARLETVSYHVERVIDLRDQQSRLFGLIKSQDAILFVAVGEVIAGVDLGELNESDVVVDKANDRVTITLPAARVFSTRLDNEHSWVYSRTTDILAQRQEDLETRARREAESTLEQVAVSQGILERARTNAENTVASLVRSLGYGSVVVRSREPASRVPSLMSSLMADSAAP
jgi:hypothetical protein